MGIKVTHGHHEYGKGVVENNAKDKELKLQLGLNPLQEQPNEEDEINESKKGQLILQRQQISEKELLDMQRYSAPKDIYFTKDLIKDYHINEAIALHPLAKTHWSKRSKIAYRDILTSCLATRKYLLPGQLVLFEYIEPKYKEELDYYDRTPFTLFCGITRTKEGHIREIGLNLHYFPPHSRAKILNTVYNVFKDYYTKESTFNDGPTRPNMFISWRALQGLLRRNQKIAFGIKMYIPVLRSRSYVLPTKMLSTAFYTEGHFSKATARMVYQFWKQFKV